ncbi:MAG: hypothetical protein IIU35_02220 [Neisseriaceae bacterium]|nr:hypothetical protein [Neisseriaceae bacterium]
MKRFLSVLALGLAFAAPALARDLPRGMEVAYMKSAQYPNVELSSGGLSWVKLLTLGLADNSQTYTLAGSVVVRNQRNATVTRGKISMFHDVFVAFKRNSNNQIQEIWILKKEEVDKFREEAASRQTAPAAAPVIEEAPVSPETEMAPQ